MEVALTPLEFARRARRLYAQHEAVVDGLLTDIPLRPKGFPFEVHFEMERNGTLKVTAEERTSGRELRLEAKVGTMTQVLCCVTTSRGTFISSVIVSSAGSSTMRRNFFVTVAGGDGGHGASHAGSEQDL